MRAAMREGTQRSPVAPFEFPDLANCACLKQLLDPTVCRQPGYWPIHRKGDVSLLGLDRVVVVAYSKDGLSSFDVLTGTLPAQ